jgi:serine/threonine protein kinase
MGRDVAIKILDERFTARFDREVRAVAALNHPNVCTLHDIGDNYLVMEFVTNVPADFNVRDFDVSSNGTEIVLERVQEDSDVVLLEMRDKLGS